MGGKSITSAAETKGTLRFPKGATLAQVSIAGQPNGRANVRITDGQGQSRTAALAVDPKRPDSASLSFEVVNNGQEWDGTVHYEAAQPGLRILCEYY